MGVALNVQIFRGPQQVAAHTFDSDVNRTVKIGRLGSAQIKLDDPAVSRIHAVIEFAGPQVSLIDMGSTVGTLVNDTKVHKVKLNHGDRVAIGETTLLVGIGGPVEVATQTPVAAVAGTAQPAGAAPVAPQQMPMAPGVAASPVAQPAMGQAVVPGGGIPAAAASPVAYAAPQGMPAQAMSAPQVAPPGSAESIPAPVRFDGGGSDLAAAVPRITKERLSRAAVESRPHPALPPEEKLSMDNRVLEMRVYWGEVLLAMHHYAEPKKITIGENKNTDFFISSEGLPTEAFPLVRFTGGDYVLAFCHGMDGEIEVDGELSTLTAVRGSSIASKDDELQDTYRITLPLKARGVIHWGGATFTLRFVPPSSPPKKSFFEQLDLQYLNTLVLSLFLHVATLVTLHVVPLDTDALRVDLFDEPDRFTQLVLEGAKKTESTKDLLKKLKKNVEEKKEKLKPKEKPELVVKTKSTRPVKSKAQKRAEVKQKFQKLFQGGGGGAGGGSMLGGGGGGSLAGTLQNVIGSTGRGSGGAIAGLGIRGSGPQTGGGIGTSRGIAGIGTSGRLGGGTGGYGGNVGGLGRAERGMISLSTPVVMGALPADVIKKVINRNKAQVRYCYEVQLQRNQNLEGRIMMTWIIAATGSVAKVRVKETTMRNPSVERCIASKIKTWKFPAPAGGGIVEVNYPFVFRAG